MSDAKTVSLASPASAADFSAARVLAAPLARFTVIFLLCLLGGIAGRLLIYPGFLDPLTPSQSDLYRYFTISHSPWTLSAWLQPRPLMLADLHALAFIRNPGALWIVLAFSSVLLAASLVFLLDHVAHTRAHPIAILLYSVVMFSLPSSYDIYQLDYGGMLAGVLAILAILVWLRWHRTRPWMALALSLLLYWFSVETKPTFPAVMFLLAAVQLVLRRNRQTLMLVLGIAAISVLVVLKDKALNSAFLQFSNSTSIYAVRVAPEQNLRALWYYMGAALPTALLPGLALVYAWFWRGRTVRLLWMAGLIALAVASMVPMAMIPNRTLDVYSWYPAMFLCIPLLYVLEGGWGRTEPAAELVARFGPALCILVMLASLLVFRSQQADPRRWLSFLRTHDRNVLDSLPRLEERGRARGFAKGGRVLVSGLYGIAHPFRQRPFALLYSHLPDDFVWLAWKSEASWNEGLQLGPLVYSDELVLDQYDYFVVYDQGGKLAGILKRDKLLAMPEQLRIPFLTCGLDPNADYADTATLEDAASCLDRAGEAAANVALIKASPATSLSPLVHYFLGHAYETLGNFAAARQEYEAALTVGEVSLFRQALLRVQDK